MYDVLPYRELGRGDQWREWNEWTCRPVAGPMLVCQSTPSQQDDGRYESFTVSPECDTVCGYNRMPGHTLVALYARGS